MFKDMPGANFIALVWRIGDAMAQEEQIFHVGALIRIDEIGKRLVDARPGKIMKEPFEARFRC